MEDTGQPATVPSSISVPTTVEQQQQQAQQPQQPQQSQQQHTQAPNVVAAPAVARAPSSKSTSPSLPLRSSHGTKSPLSTSTGDKTPPVPASPAAAGGGGWGGWLGGGLSSLLASERLTDLSNSINTITKPATETLTNIVSAALSTADAVDLPSKEEQEELGITRHLVEFVANVSRHPSTFTHFPLEEDDAEVLVIPQLASTSPLSGSPRKKSDAGDLGVVPSEGAALVYEKRRRLAATPFKLTPLQTRHVTAVLALVPDLQKV
eukprot:TRINITY_DN5019_c1_g1_i1.p1 TRINITY_DN5019_c1_g1~~TRINITY_DN5019_c1_g1_i1.p1  ORF type:complete len:264 (+),score=70.12 TRINITY_DN5019_c1_g1_i1:14-805(+)